MWFGESEDPPLPGERISVLAMESGLEARTDGTPPQIVLPPPEPASAWPQAAGWLIMPCST